MRENGGTVIEVWEAQAVLDRFVPEQLGAALQAAGIDVPPRTVQVTTLMTPEIRSEDRLDARRALGLGSGRPTVNTTRFDDGASLGTSYLCLRHAVPAPWELFSQYDRGK